MDNLLPKPDSQEITKGAKSVEEEDVRSGVTFTGKPSPVAAKASLQYYTIELPQDVDSLRREDDRQITKISSEKKGFKA